MVLIDFSMQIRNTLGSGKYTGDNDKIVLMRQLK